jgi:hypothetical protein
MNLEIEKYWSAFAVVAVVTLVLLFSIVGCFATGRTVPVEAWVALGTFGGGIIGLLAVPKKPTGGGE